ncbi:undecaprenyldiphospho-muramoylpentapeptide beta-N-acetylglucosaminyltransferase [Membranihabitans marinus]
MISGGGTGGHIFPAIAIGNALLVEQPGTQLLYVGAKGKMEMSRIPAAGFEIEGLWISGIDRKKMWKNILFPFKLFSSLWKSYRLIKKFSPDVVVGVGGFASGPLLEMASRLNVPSLIQEQNSVAGLTNRLLAKKVDKICVAFDGMERYFPKEKIVYTGNPVRANLLKESVNIESEKLKWNIQPQCKVVVSLGGSLGARTLNQMFRDQTDLIAANPNIHFVWQYGKLYKEEYSQCDTAKLDNVSAFEFIDDMSSAYTIADMVIARAGALTLAELAVVAKPALLIPSPNVADDHQTKNAEQLANMDAAIVLSDSEAREKGLALAIDSLENTERLDSLSRNIAQYGSRDAARVIANEIVDLKSKS